MKQNLKFFVGLAAIVAGLAACDNQALDPVVSNPDQIAFRIDGPMFEASAGTKSITEVAISDLVTNGFRVHALAADPDNDWGTADPVIFTQMSGTVYGSTKFWPATDPQYSFYAVYPSSYAITRDVTDGANISLVNVSSDVIAAKAVHPDVGSLYKQVNDLNFQHILACLDNVNVKALDGYSIDNLVIRMTPVKTADYNIKLEWGAAATANRNYDSSSAQAIYTLVPEGENPNPFGDADANGEKTSSSSPDLLLVPGNYELSATWTVTQGVAPDAVSRTYTDKRVRVQLDPGKKSTVTVRLGAQIMFDVSVTAWDTATIVDTDGNLTFPVS